MDWPPPPEHDENEVTFHRVASVGAIRPDSPVIVRVGVKRIALFSVDGTIRAINNVCPHGGGSLGLGKVSGRMVLCPRHEWGFDLESGDCPGHEPYVASTYVVEVRGDGIYVGIPHEIW